MRYKAVTGKSRASVLGESGESTSESSLSCSYSSSGGDESELEAMNQSWRKAESEHGAIEPYMYEPVASNESAESDGASGKPEVEERRHSTGWYVAVLLLHYKLSPYMCINHSV